MRQSVTGRRPQQRGTYPDEPARPAPTDIPERPTHDSHRDPSTRSPSPEMTSSRTDTWSARTPVARSPLICRSQLGRCRVCPGRPRSRRRSPGSPAIATPAWPVPRTSPVERGAAMRGHEDRERAAHPGLPEAVRRRGIPPHLENRGDGGDRRVLGETGDGRQLAQVVVCQGEHSRAPRPIVDCCAGYHDQIPGGRRLGPSHRRRGAQRAVTTDQHQVAALVVRRTVASTPSGALRSRT